MKKIVKITQTRIRHSKLEDLHTQPTNRILWRHDIQHNDNQLNDTQNNGLIYDTQHNSINSMECPFAGCRILIVMFKCHYAECRYTESHVADYVVGMVSMHEECHAAEGKQTCSYCQAQLKFVNFFICRQNKVKLNLVQF